MYEVVIVGAGPAGLNAALVLARCRRRILVFDTGNPRNACSHGLHGYLTRDGIQPPEFLQIGRQELECYGVEVRQMEVKQAVCADGMFNLTLADGSRIAAKKLLLATGVIDAFPPIDGIHEFYGRSVHHCPYCDAWEVRDQPLAVYARGTTGTGLALSLKTWSDDVVLCTGGPARFLREERERLERHGIRIDHRPIARLEGANGILKQIVFKDGSALPRRAMFFSTSQRQRSDLARSLGCEFTEKGAVRANRKQGTGVPGLYVAGDAARDVQFVIVAAAEGAKAAVDINKALQAEERK